MIWGELGLLEQKALRGKEKQKWRIQLNLILTALQTRHITGCLLSCTLCDPQKVRLAQYLFAFDSHTLLDSVCFLPAVPNQPRRHTVSFYEFLFPPPGVVGGETDFSYMTGSLA